MHRDFRIGGIDCAIRLLARAAERVRHRRACVSLDLGWMAELAAARSCGLVYDLLRRDLRIAAGRCTAVGLSSSRGNNRHENAQNNEQLPGSTFRAHGSVEIHRLTAGGIVPRLLVKSRARCPGRNRRTGSDVDYSFVTSRNQRRGWQRNRHSRSQIVGMKRDSPAKLPIIRTFNITFESNRE